MGLKVKGMFKLVGMLTLVGGALGWGLGCGKIPEVSVRIEDPAPDGTATPLAPQAPTGSGTGIQSPDRPATPMCGNQRVQWRVVCDGDSKPCAELDPQWNSGQASCKGDCTGYDLTPCSVKFQYAIVVEPGLLARIRPALEQHVADLLAKDKLSAKIVEWTGKNHVDLRSLLQGFYKSSGLEGALLVGNLPAAWFYLTSNKDFPSDLFFMEMDGEWKDTNADSIYDVHPPMNIDLYVSRIMGTADEIQRYFEKNHAYRQTGSTVQKRYFLFVDDDWLDCCGPYAANLPLPAYSDIARFADRASTTKDSWIRVLTEGAEYSWGWIHGWETGMDFMHNGSPQRFTLDEMKALDLKSVFWHLRNCHIARFTQTNIAMYVIHTPYGMVSTGSTLSGAMEDSRVFHESLSAGKTWGQAFIDWYNQVGKTNDDWNLGQVMMGDPTLRLSRTLSQSLYQAAKDFPPVSKEASDQALQAMQADGRAHPPKTFADYQRENPQFFQ